MLRTSCGAPTTGAAPVRADDRQLAQILFHLNANLMNRETKRDASAEGGGRCTCHMCMHMYMCMCMCSSQEFFMLLVFDTFEGLRLGWLGR